MKKLDSIEKNEKVYNQMMKITELGMRYLMNEASLSRRVMEKTEINLKFEYENFCIALEMAKEIKFDNYTFWNNISSSTNFLLNYSEGAKINMTDVG